MSHQPSLGSSPKTNQGPEARSISKIWRWSHSLANKADLLFRAPAKAPAAPPAMCSYDRVLTFFTIYQRYFSILCLKGGPSKWSELPVRSTCFCPRHHHRAAKPEPQSVTISFPSTSLPLQMSHCSFSPIRCPLGWEMDTHRVIFIS